MPVSRHSKFDLRLLQQHVREASTYVMQCERDNKKVLDVCGERGDLYFLLSACLLQQKCTDPSDL